MQRYIVTKSEIVTYLEKDGKVLPCRPGEPGSKVMTVPIRGYLQGPGRRSCLNMVKRKVTAQPDDVRRANHKLTLLRRTELAERKQRQLFRARFSRAERRALYGRTAPAATAPTALAA